MWLITNFGVFSVVQKPGDRDQLTVRARVRDDLDRLRATFLPTLSKTIEGGGTDYPYRAQAAASAVAEAFGKAVQGIDYSNFKNEATAKLGTARGKIYGRVWAALFDLSKIDALKRRWPKANPNP
jgi:hypothetical protein